jgi:peptidoglycan hydrolase-like protein with peptidoglycan-binding domain
MLLVSGCGIISEFTAEARKEKEILGDVKGFNPRVEKMEKTLQSSGYPVGTVDGIFDRDARKAIVAFQKAHRLPPTGYIGEATYTKLNMYAIEISSKRQAVALSTQKIKEAQAALRKAGFDPGPITGVMNEKTKKAIIAFQKLKGLTADGIVGAKTWTELKKYLP